MSGRLQGKYLENNKKEKGGGRFGNAMDNKEGMGTFDWCTDYTVGKPVRCIKATKEEIEYAKD